MPADVGSAAEMCADVPTRTLSVVAKEARIILRFTLPLMLRMYLRCAADRLAIAWVGHYDATPDHIAGALLGKMYSNITGLSVGVGLALGVSTYASQNHGRGDDRRNGEVLRQCGSAMAVAYVFSVVAAAISAPLLGALGQPRGVLRPCQLFSLVQALGLPGVWTSSAVANVLVSQGIVGASVFCDCTAALFNLTFTGLFVRVCGMGYIGAAWATVLSNWTQFSLYMTYVVVRRKQDTVWRVPPAVSASLSAPKLTLRMFLATSLPSAFSLWAEWWAAEIQAVFAGLLPGGELAVGGNGLLFNTLAICYMTFVATQIATTTRVGNLVGARDVRRIPTSIATSLAITVALSAAVAGALYVWGSEVLHIYTDEAGILGEATRAHLGMVLSVPPYALMMCLLGALRGAGLQAWGAVSLFFAFYVVGLPAGALMGLKMHMDLLGIWLGNVTSLSLAAVAMGARVCTVQWGPVVQRAADRAAARAELLA